jgi:hypothetical protein
MNIGQRRIGLGRHLVADSEICPSKPTFKDTRTMAWQVLEDMVGGRSWEVIRHNRRAGRVALQAVAQALRLKAA